MNSNYAKQTLSNGLRLVTIPMPGVRSVTALVLVGVGSRQEKKKTRGITHFLEHLPFKGTKKYPTSLKLSSVLDAVGAEYNAFTGKEYTGFYVKSASEHLELGLDFLSQLIFHPLLEEEEIKKEKGVIIEEINMYEDQPMVKVMWDFETLLYGNTSLGWETLGTKETVAGFGRGDFSDYMKRWYCPGNMVIGIAGAIPQAQSVKRKVQSLFSTRSDFQGSPTEGRLKFEQQRPVLAVKYKKTAQAHLCLGVRTFKRNNPDRYALSLLATILGGNMSSRMFTEVREKRGLAYYIKTAGQSYIDNGYLVTRAGTDIRKTGEAIKVIQEEYQKVRGSTPKASHLGGQAKFEVRESELKKAKEYVKGKLILGLEDSEEVASLYVDDLLLEGKIRTPEEILKAVDKVSIADIKKVAGEIFRPENLNMTVIGPFKDKEKFEKLLR